MKVNEYVVSFIHGEDTAQHLILGDRYPKDYVLRFTNCAIFLIKEDQQELVASENAVCSPLDTFTKKDGRKKSLTKTLKASNLPKEVRKYIWEKYYELHKKE